MSGKPPVDMLWRDLPAGETPEAHVGDLVRRLGDPELPGDDRFAAIRARITLRRGPRLVRRNFTWVLVVGALLIGATLGVAAPGLIAPLRERLRPTRTVPAAAPHRQGGGRSTFRPAPTAAPVPAPEVVVVTPPSDPAAAAPVATAPVIAIGPAPGARRRPPGALIASTSPRPVETPREAAALATAIRKLRRENDARGALAALDAHAAAFPDGELRAEADLVRVEALLATGERATALRLLDERADTNPRARQALLARGELRASVGRCADAVRDLGRVLTSPPRDGLDERALFARASCASSMRDYPAARGDLQAYLRHFPNGSHARQAAQALDALPATP